MEPLQSIPMPTHAVLLSITAANSWPTGPTAQPVRLAYIATNSSERLSFVSLQSSADTVIRMVSRPAHFDDMPFGVVIELYLTRDIAEGEAIYLALAQAGATSYYPPQQIDDLG